MRFKSLIFMWVLVMTAVAGCLVLSHGAGTGTGVDQFAELRSIIDKGVNSIGRSNLDNVTVSAIHKAGDEYLSRHPVSAEKKAETLFSHLDAELVELQKRELYIKVLLGQISWQECDSKQFAGCAQFLGRYRVGDIESSLFAFVTAAEIRGIPIYSDAKWQSLLLSYLNAKDRMRTVIADQLLIEAKKTNWTASGEAILPEWSAGEQREIAGAVLMAEKRILARRYIVEKLKVSGNNAQ